MNEFAGKYCSRKNLLIAGLVVLLIVLCGVIVYNGYVSGGAAAAGGMVLNIDDNAVPLFGALPEDLTPDTPGIKIPGYGSITIPAGQTDVGMKLLNPDGNPCYFTFEVVLDETGDTIYTSGMVEPAMCIEHVRLDYPLEAGEYPATIRIRTFALDSLTDMNNANVQTVLKVV